MNPNWIDEPRKEAEEDMASLTQARSERGEGDDVDLEGVEGGRGVAFVQEHFADEVVRVKKWKSQAHVEVKPERIVEMLTALKEDEELQYEYLSDITGVDHLELRSYDYRERFGVAYILVSFKHNDWLRVKALLPEKEPTIDSLAPVWPGATNLEREVYDMYGVHFEGNPNLIRILMPEGYEGHPLRKDYPLQGRGERFDFAKITPEYRPEEAPDAAKGIHRGSPRKQRELE